MQVNQVSYKTADSTKYRQNRLNKNNKPAVSLKHYNINGNIKQETGKSVSFKGLGPIDTFALKVADLIENGGLFVSFTIQDMLGTNLPRPFMGLKRNSKENEGKKNFSFAAKEFVREMLTGPSMFLIPGGMLAVGNKIFGKSTEVPMKFIKAFGDIHAANPVNAEGKVIGKQDFYKNTFTEILKNAKNETEPSEATINKAAEFAKKITENIKDKASKKDTISKLADEFTDIAKRHSKDPVYTDFTRAFVSKTTSGSFDDAVSFAMSYADDVVEKVKIKNPENVQKFVNKMTNKKVIGRLGANLAMYGAVMAFLQIIPKLYNKAEGKENAGLKGLMKEETLNDKSLNSQVQKEPKTKDKQEEKKDKSNPSFGSSGVVNKLTGNGLIGRMAQGIEFEGMNLSFPLLLGIMGFGILLPRTRQAKDKYDREEIIRRDLVTCTTMCFAEKELRKGFSKLNEKTSGLVLALKDEKFKNKNIFGKIFDYFRPIKGVQTLSTSQIISKYSGIDKYKDGITGFCEFIDGQGGNLSKVFSLTDESKNLVDDLLQQEGKNIKNADNSVIKDILTKAKDSEQVQKLVKLFENKDNPWVKKAKTINSRFTTFSVLVLVPVFLGFMLPWINERATKKRINKEQALNNNKSSDMTFILNNDKSTSVFSDMNKYIK